MNNKQNGKLKYYCAQKIDKHVKLIYVKTDSAKGYRTNIDNIVFNYLNTKSLNQLFINVVQEPAFLLDVSGFNNQNYLDTCSNSSALYFFNRNLSIINPVPQPTDIFFIANYSVKVGDAGEKGGFHTVNGRGGVLYSTSNSSINTGNLTAHELGHWLGFYHPFEEGINNKTGKLKLPAFRKIKQGQTQNNFMDYFNDNGRRKSWFQYQLWITKKNTHR